MLVNSLGIIGYGRFGKLLVEILSKDFQVMAYDTNLPTGYSLEKVASADAIFLCIPIIELEATAKQLATLVRPGTIIKGSSLLLTFGAIYNKENRCLDH